MTSTATIPIKLLMEAVKHSVTVELKNGEVYRGELTSAEENMNVEMSSVTFTARDGRVKKLEQIFLRGSHIRFVVLPDFIKKAPILAKVTQMKQDTDKKKMDKRASAGRGRGRGRGKA